MKINDNGKLRLMNEQKKISATTTVATATEAVTTQHLNCIKDGERKVFRG